MKSTIKTLLLILVCLSSLSPSIASESTCQSEISITESLNHYTKAVAEIFGINGSLNEYRYLNDCSPAGDGWSVLIFYEKDNIKEQYFAIQARFENNEPVDRLFIQSGNGSIGSFVVEGGALQGSGVILNSNSDKAEYFSFADGIAEIKTQASTGIPSSEELELSENGAEKFSFEQMSSTHTSLRKRKRLKSNEINPAICTLVELQTRFQELIGDINLNAVEEAMDCYLFVNAPENAISISNYYRQALNREDFDEILSGELSLAHFEAGHITDSFKFALLMKPGGYGSKQTKELKHLARKEYQNFGDQQKAKIFEYSKILATTQVLAGRTKNALENCMIGKSCNALPIHPANVLAAEACDEDDCVGAINILEDMLGLDPTFASKLLLPLRTQDNFLSKPEFFSQFSEIRKRFKFPTAATATPVVRIITYADDGSRDHFGSGVYISEKHILTNYHVVSDLTGVKYENAPTKANIRLSDITNDTPESITKSWKSIRRYFPLKARVVARDAKLDLALIELEGVGRTKITPIAIPAIHNPGLGSISTIGFPGLGDSKDRFSMRPTIGHGTFIEMSSAKAAFYKNSDLTLDLPFQHSGLSAQGMSGGPVTNVCGELLTLNTALTIQDTTKLTAGGRGASTKAIKEFLSDNGISSSKDSRPCLRFGSDAIANKFHRVVAVRFKDRDQVTGILIGQKLLFYAPKPLNKGNRIGVYLKNGDVRFTKIAGIDGESRIALAYLGKKNEGSNYDISEYYKWNRKFEEFLHTDNQTPPTKGEKLIVVSALNSQSLPVRKILEYDENLGISRFNRELTIDNVTVESVSKNTFNFVGHVNPNTLGAPIFDSCGYLRRFVTSINGTNRGEVLRMDKRHETFKTILTITKKC